MASDNSDNNHSKFLMGAALLSFGTALITFGPFLLQAIQHWQTKEQRELTKELTRLQVEEMAMKVATMRESKS